MGDLTLELLVLIKILVHDARAAGHFQEVGPKSDQAPGRDQEIHADGADGSRLHIFHRRFSGAEGFDDRALVALVDFD